MVTAESFCLNNVFKCESLQMIKTAGSGPLAGVEWPQQHWSRVCIQYVHLPSTDCPSPVLHRVPVKRLSSAGASG